MAIQKKELQKIICVYYVTSVVRQATQPPWDKGTLDPISNYPKGLTQISVERIWQEISKILAGNNVANVLLAMDKTGVTKVIGLLQII